MLKLYSSSVSPFGARVLITFRAKGVPFEDLGSPQERWPDLGFKSPEFLAINPIGKVPVLILEDGSPLVESEAIITYLDEAYPDPPLQPADRVARARMRAAIRVCETYVMAPIQHTFPLLDPAARDPAVLKAEFGLAEKGLAYLARHVSDETYIVDGRLTLADIVIFTALYLTGVMPQVFGMPDLIGTQPKLARYFERAHADPLLAEAHAGLTATSH